MRAVEILFCSLAILLIPTVQGEIRTFTDDTGRQVEAELVGLRGDNVVLKRNGKLAQWPVKKLSAQDQNYVKVWKKVSPATPELAVRIWERDGIGEQGVLNSERMDSSIPGKNIPILKSTEEKGYYKHYDVDIHNNSGIDASNLIVAYVLFVIDPQNQVVGENGRDSVDIIPSGERKTIKTQGITYVRTKTTTATFSTNILGNLSVGSATDRSREKFGGAWVRIYSLGGELAGEAKQFSPLLEKLNPAWTGYSGEQQILTPSSFSKLEEFFGPLKKLIESLPEPPASIPKPPGNFPFPPGGPPKPPF
ncbi:MAG: SHD1 domain-containing protein [Verrucomicrobiales bacterium]|nr:SHD1 domain-containing protein [Verrucomicrobiales bacterium]